MAPCDAQAEIKRLTERVAQLARALERIVKWQGEFPDSGRAWEDGTPMSYSAAFGSNGERDYMRSIARSALAPPAQKPPQPRPSQCYGMVHTNAGGAWIRTRGCALDDGHDGAHQPADQP